MSDWWKDYWQREADRVKQLQEYLKANLLEETDGEDVVLCPYCGENDSDDRYDGEGEHQYTCGWCGMDYSCTVHVSISYSTKRIKEAK